VLFVKKKGVEKEGGIRNQVGVIKHITKKKVKLQL